MPASLVLAYNEFGINLFGQLRRQAEDRNLFISPLSVATALAMTYNGAAGETARGMARTLRLEGRGLGEVNQGSADLLAGLKSADPKTELALANSLWARRGVEFKPDFLARSRQFFGAEVATLDFGDPRSTERINRWVADGTRGRITRVVEQLPAQTVMLLVNAVYFKGRWQTSFDKSLTRGETFHLPAGRTKSAQMMKQSGSYEYLRGEKFQAVSLPYGASQASLYLFLPDEGQPLGDFLRGLSRQSWEQWLTRFRRAEGEIKIPRFKLADEHDLSEPLKALGMADAFDPARADFTGMRAARDLFIEQVKHKAEVEVNEEGTEASAATSIAIGVTSVQIMPQRFNFVADRPFLIALRDQRTGAVLFLGAVQDPQ